MTKDVKFCDFYIFLKKIVTNFPNLKAANTHKTQTLRLYVSRKTLQTL